MTKLTSASATLEELWTIKDQTAERFKSAADYFAYLQSQTKGSSSRVKPVLKKASLARRVRALAPST
jgi:hypothetical protein